MSSRGLRSLGLWRALALAAALAFSVTACANSSSGGDGPAPPPNGGDGDTATGEDTAPPPPLTYYRVGMAEGNINPDYPVPLGGFGMGGGGPETLRYSRGVHDDLVVNAFAVQETATGDFVILLGMDGLGLMPEDIAAIEDRLRVLSTDALGAPLPAGRFILSASHAHSTPDTVGLYSNFPDEGRDQGYLAKIYDVTAQVVLDAYLALEDAEIVTGTGTLETDIMVPGQGNDPAIFVLKATRPDGSVIGTLTNWGAHPTVYGHLNYAASADYVGTFRYKLAETLGGGVHVFLQGPIGGIYPIWDEDECAEENPFQDGYKDPAETAHPYVACVGFDLARAVAAALATATPIAEEPIQLRMGTFTITVENIVFVALARQGIVEREFFQTQDRKYATEGLIGWVRFGGIEFTTAPGEAFPRYANALRGKLEEHGATETVVIGLGNDWVGYLLLEEQYKDDAYGYHRGLSPGPRLLDDHLAALETLLTD